jgi:hypothetical protein
MQTSRRSILIEAAAASAVAVAIAGLLAPHGLGLGTLYPHPVWLAAMVIGARYGGRGLTIAVPAAWGTLALVATWLQVAPRQVLLRLTAGAGPDLGALIAAILVSWIASGHERRSSTLAAQLAAVHERFAAEQAALAELRRAAVTLRARADRLDASLTFVRDVATRLGGDDADAAAQAALDLVVARLGARAAVVQVLGAEGLAPLASAGVWSPGGVAGGPGVADDHTAAAVVRTHRPVRAVDLPEGGPSDSDLAAPILDERGDLVGVLAVRGVPLGGASAAALRDLAIVAAWSARAIKRARPDASLPASAAVAAAALEAEDGPTRPVRIPSRVDFTREDRDPDEADDTGPPRTISRINA